MRICLLTLNFEIPGCRSLKEKRRAFAGFRERFGRMVNLAVCESDYHDIHDRAQYSIIAAAGSPKIVDSMLNQVEAYADEELDAVILSARREEL